MDVRQSRCAAACVPMRKPVIFMAASGRTGGRKRSGVRDEVPFDG